MTWIEYSALAVSSVIFIIGLITSLLPVVPGNFIVWAGIVVHKLWMGDSSVGWDIVLLTLGITIVGQLADVFMGIWGARKFGASWKGALGAFGGALIGFVIPPPIFWLIVGPVVGAVIGELYAGRTWQDGSKAGIGTVIGGVLAFALKFGLSLCILGIFFLGLFF